jgi:ABC-2 type transport system ATP-binding protein
MPHAIEIKALKKTYANGVSALKGIDLVVKQGDFFALLGANGAGKSTTIGLIATLLSKTSGHIAINGYDIDTQTTQAKQCLGLVPQEVNLNIFESCEQTLLNQAGYYGIPRRRARVKTEQLLKQLNLWGKRHTIVRHLSGGMKRRLMIARALVHDPSVLILDEPTAGVDVEIRRDMWAFLSQINAQGTTIILTTHYLEEAEQLCKQIAIIHNGQIIQNTGMQTLLNTLKHQTYVLSLANALTIAPNFPEWTATLLDPHTLELRVNNAHALNDVFMALNNQGIQVQSLRNKTNRLEELFMDLIHHEP